MWGGICDFARQRHVKRIIVWVMIDGLILLLAYTAAFFARAITTPLDYLYGFGFILLSIAVTLVSLYFFGVYHRIWSQTSGHGVTVIVSAIAVATLAVGLVDVLLAEPRPLPLSVIALANALALTGLVAARYRSRLVSGLSWRWDAIWHRKFPTTDTRVLIVGAGEAGQTLALRLQHRWRKNSDHRYQVVGFVDDDPDKRDLYVEGRRVLGTRADIPRLVEAHNVDLIVLAVHNITGPAFREVLAYCEATGARIKVIPDAYAWMTATEGVGLLRDVQAEDILGRSPVGRHEAVDFEPVTGRRILVTGAAGSIGSELSRQLLQYSPVALVLLDNNESALHDLLTELAPLPGGAFLVPVLADITDRQALDAVFARHRPQVVFHAAAYKHVPMLELFPYEAVRVNIVGTRLVAELARNYGTERFVLISTDKAVDPTSVMGASKRICELLMHALAGQGNAHTRFTSVRFGNVLGSRGSVVPLFNRQIDAGGPVTVTHKDMTRYFMSTSEAVNLVIHAACMTRGDDLFMLQMGEVIRIVELAERMIRLRGLVPYKDVAITFTGVRPGEKMHEELRHQSETAVPTEHPHIVRLVNREAHFAPSIFLEELEKLIAACDPLTADCVQRAQAVATEAEPGFHRPDHSFAATMLQCIERAYSPNGQR